MKKRTILIAAGAVVIAVQFVPVDREGAPAEQPLQAPAEVMAVLEQSCFDCHSARTDWPWYGYVAPVSWYVARDVHEAREHLDFSRWGSMSAQEQTEMKGEILEEVQEEEMPLPVYLVMHRDAELDAEDQRILQEWAGPAVDAGHEHEHDHDH